MDNERAETGESLTVWSSGISGRGGLMLRLSLTMVAVLVESRRPMDLKLLIVEGEGAVVIGGNDGDLKRMAGYPSLTEVSLVVLVSTV